MVEQSNNKVLYASLSDSAPKYSGSSSNHDPFFIYGWKKYETPSLTSLNLAQSLI